MFGVTSLATALTRHDRRAQVRAENHGALAFYEGLEFMRDAVVRPGSAWSGTIDPPAVLRGRGGYFRSKLRLASPRPPPRRGSDRRQHSCEHDRVGDVDVPDRQRVRVPEIRPPSTIRCRTAPRQSLRPSPSDGPLAPRADQAGDP